MIVGFLAIANLGIVRTAKDAYYVGYFLSRLASIEARKSVWDIHAFVACEGSKWASLATGWLTAYQSGLCTTGRRTSSYLDTMYLWAACLGHLTDSSGPGTPRLDLFDRPRPLRAVPRSLREPSYA
ncbi:predicted protein [Plenodomus lingam JN3]|uniref:Predicted protein n=1 Tax=Leptosphaeria maculans (strain JN3 / isolate v23.1.3 / race Av1-4-5-6-7-8) TaxID=985895 RepID=E4ZNV8_LEPMJ|nr:predicted protein [Plenodomus lingam JN3]CBX93327.1 predicted protein [Plenodomus lingam JN3]